MSQENVAVVRRGRMGRSIQIETTFTTTPAIVMRSYRACHRLAHLFRLLVVVALLAIGLVQGSVFALVLGVAAFALPELVVRRQLGPYLSGERSVSVAITEDEYRIQGPDRTTSRTWDAFRNVRRVGNFWVFRISTTNAMALPVTALDDEQTEEFKALMRHKGLLRAGLRE